MTRKKWKKGLALAAALLALSSGSALAETFCVSKVAWINLRQGPSAATELIDRYPADTWLTILGEKNGWYSVIGPDGQEGYVGARQVELPEAPVVTVGVVSNLESNAYVNLREKPNYQAKVLGTYHNGAPCLLLSQSEGWYHVRLGTLDGYLRAEYVERQRMAWTEQTATVVTQSGPAALREGPGEQYPVLGSYGHGQYVVVIRQGNGWWMVSVDGQMGYMDASQLREGVLSYEELLNARWSTLKAAYAVVANPATTQLLNLRSQPSTLSEVLGQYRNGTRLTLLNQGEEWCRVANDQGTVGYMMTQYLTLEGVRPEPVMTVSQPDETYVNLRSMPSTTLGTVLEQVPHGAQVTVLVPGSEWVKVRYGETTGYMVAWFLVE